MVSLKNYIVSFGLIQCIALLIIYIVLLNTKNDALLIFFYFYTLLLGFSILKNKNNSLLSNNSALILLIFIFLYGVFNPLVEYFLSNVISEDGYISTILYAIAMASLLFGVATKKNKCNYYENYKNNLSTDQQNGLYVIFLVSVLILLIVYKSYFYYSIGVLFSFNYGGMENRLDMFSSIGQLDIVIGMIIIGIFSYFIFYYKNMKKTILILIGFLLLYYILLQVSVGNRRDFTPVIISIFWVYVCIRRIRFNLIAFSALLIVVFLFNYFGTLRVTGDERLQKNEIITLTFTSNEFVYPFYTTRFEVEEQRKDPYMYEYKYGYTYLVNSFTIFIPRLLYPNKPQSLANQILVRMFGNNVTMGYAYSPITEAFINFGYLGSFIVFFLIGRLLIWLNNTRKQWFNFIFFITLIDFCRSDMASYIYLVTFISIPFILHNYKVKIS